MIAAQQAKKESSGFGCLVLFGIVAAGVYWVWNAADENGYIPHTKIAIVTAKNWSIGEYKSCTSPNIIDTRDEPQIECSSFADYGEPKKFEVRFYGMTYREDLKNKASFTWRCKKNDGTDPAFTCDEQKVIKWDEKQSPATP